MQKSKQGERRVVITGLGVVSSIGIGKESFCDSLRAGRSGIRQITSFDATSYDCQIAGEISDFDPADFMPAQTARRIDRFAQFGLAAARLAVNDAGLDVAQEDTGAVGIILGTSIGTLCYAERQIALFYEKGAKRINPFFSTSVIPSSATTQIMLDLGIHGPSRTITTACASATSSVGEAFHRVKDGELDVILAGGAEAPITPLVLSTLSAIRLLSVSNETPAQAYRAFSNDAAGFVLGEGSGILILIGVGAGKAGPAVILSFAIAGVICACAARSGSTGCASCPRTSRPARKPRSPPASTSAANCSWRW